MAEKIKSVHFVKFRNSEQVVSGISTRKGGISVGAYESLNLGKNTEDTPFFISENRIRYVNEFNASVDQMVLGNQCHSNYVQFVYKPGLYDKVDGFLTNQKKILLNISVADCFPVWFYDATKPIIGVIHAGWRGIDEKIHLNMIKEMMDSGSKIENIEAIIGPGIRECHFEVSKDTAERFEEKYRIKPQELDKFYINLPLLIKDDLLSEGISPELIQDMNECTFCLKDKYFSHRRDKGITGRMFAGIMLK